MIVGTGVLEEVWELRGPWPVLGALCGRVSQWANRLCVF